MKLRKLTSALVAAGALSSPWALGLGLGDIQLKSALNQPLQAEIRLLQTRELAQEEILPSLAAQEEFERAGVERFFFLSDIDFDVTLSGKGDGSLLLTTKQSIQEPFLNFLVEVNWPNGRVLREYTVLLDPPVYEDEVLAPVVTPKAASSEKVLMEAEKQSTVQRNSQAVATEAAVAAKRSNSASRVQDGTFGPVKSSDTLWDIALAVRPSRSVTVQQTMMSIRELNPSAFVAGNINKIKKGAVLRIPTLNQIENWKYGSAVEEVAAHNKRYKNSINPDGSGQVQLSAVDQPMQAPIVAPEEARLKIVRSEEKAAAAGAASGDQEGDGPQMETLQNELAITQENLDKANRENEKLAERLQALESQMSKLSRLVTLKNTDMAELQMTSSEVSDGLEQEVVPEDQLSAGMTEKLADQDLESTQKEASSSEMAVSEIDETDVSQSEAVVDESVVDEAVLDEPVIEAPSLEEPILAEAAPLESESVDKPVIKFDDAQGQMAPPQQQGLIQKILGNPIWLIGLGAGSLLFVILLFMMSRRSYQRENELAEVIEQGGLPEKSSTEIADDELDNIDQELDSLDLEPQGFGQVSLDSDDAIEPDDVVARADSFIAYGQFDNAINILDEAINKESGRIDLRLKMLEVYAEMQDSQGFERQKKEILDLGADDVIAQINVLEQKLPGFMGDSASVNAFDSGESLASEGSVLDDADFGLTDGNDNDDFSYSLEDLESELASDLSGETSLQESSEKVSDLDGLDFNLDEELGLGEESSDVKSDVADEEFSLDFDVVDDSAPAADDELASLEGLEMPDFESDLAIDSEASEILEDADHSDSTVATELSMDSELDLDSGVDSEMTASEDIPAPEDNVLGGDLDADLDALSLDLDDGLVNESVESSIDLDSDMDIEADLEDLAKSLGVDSADEVDLDAELASASDMGADSLSDDAATEEVDLNAEEISESQDEDFGALDSQEQDDEAPEVMDAVLDSELSEVSAISEELDVSVESENESVDSEELNLSSESVEQAQAPSEVESEVQSTLEEDELDFYVGTDEVATKLDLARAYVDMGDLDGARDILEEVVLEGNEDQKTEATDILNGLS